jgi:hypothetical protein
MHLDEALHPAEAVALGEPISLDSKRFDIRSSAVEPPAAARGSPMVFSDIQKNSNGINALSS